MLFKSGEIVMYGTTGVCEVMGLKTPDLPGVDQEKEYYELRPLFQSGTIYAPVENGKVFVRRAISAAEAEKLIDMIPTIRAEAFHSPKLQQLSEHYQSAIETHECADLIGLTMSIYAKRQYVRQNNLKLGQVDERFLKRAEELLFGEFSVALGIPPKEVPQYIASRVGNISGAPGMETE